MRQLVVMDCAALVRVSQDVQRWNAMLLQDLCAMCGMSHCPSNHPAATEEDDLAFWQTAIKVSLRTGFLPNSGVCHRRIRCERWPHAVNFV